METRVRFAPSPTGNVHIGNIRVAIFNWLFAKNTNGKFLLRIEDTDKERCTKEAIDNLLSSMAWLDLEYDEDIFYQSLQAYHHLSCAELMINNNYAYRKDNAIIFSIPYDLSSFSFVRKIGHAEMKIDKNIPVKISKSGISFNTISNSKSVAKNICLAGVNNLILSDDNNIEIFNLDREINDIIKNDKIFNLSNCVKMSFTRYEVFFSDLVKGELSKPIDDLKDFAIVRSDNTPIFHLGNVIDDITQNISHVIRGDDHVENTYRHLFLFSALNHPHPIYAHLPMIVNNVGKPFSKRDGDAYVGDFKTKGYLPDAFFNYLTLLGWSPGNNVEKINKKDSSALFDLKNVKSSPAQMDINKLFNLNGEYISQMSNDDFVNLAYGEFTSSFSGSVDMLYFGKVTTLMKSRTKLLTQIKEWSYFFTDLVSIDSKLFEKHINNPIAINACKELSEMLLKDRNNSAENYSSLIDDICRNNNIEHGKLNLMFRVAITGTNLGAGLFETMELLGNKKCYDRLVDIINRVKS